MEVMSLRRPSYLAVRQASKPRHQLRTNSISSHEVVKRWESIEVRARQVGAVPVANTLTVPRPNRSLRASSAVIKASG